MKMNEMAKLLGLTDMRAAITKCDNHGEISIERGTSIRNREQETPIR